MLEVVCFKKRENLAQKLAVNGNFSNFFSRWLIEGHRNFLHGKLENFGENREFFGWIWKFLLPDSTAPRFQTGLTSLVWSMWMVDVGWRLNLISCLKFWAQRCVPRLDIRCRLYFHLFKTTMRLIFWFLRLRILANALQLCVAIYGMRKMTSDASGAYSKQTR